VFDNHGLSDVPCIEASTKPEFDIPDSAFENK